MNNDIIAPQKDTKVIQPAPLVSNPAKRDGSSQSDIRLHILLRLAYKNLAHKKLRTFLTVFGVIIGIGAVVFLISFASGLRNLVSKQVLGSRSVNSITITSPHSQTVKLSTDKFTKIRNMKGVTTVGKLYSAAGKTGYSGSNIDTVIYGADNNYMNLTSLKFTAGKNLDFSSNQSILINLSLQKALGASANDVLGKSVSLDFNVTDSKNGETHVVKKDFKITGVVDDGSASEAFINYRLFENAGDYNASQFNAEASSGSDVTKIRQNIEALGLSTTSPLDTIAQINQVFSIMRYIVVGFGGIGIITAVFGMFNTLTISLLERTREIGLMISLGARRRDIKRLFLLESIFISFIGGFAGLVGAGVLGLAINVVINMFAHHRGVTGTVNVFTITPLTTVVTLVLSVILGLLVAYLPVRRAARINPIDALRYE